MPSSSTYIQSLVDRPQETLNVELKDWFDPHTPEGQSKIVRACIAMRNYNGGRLQVGFDNQSWAPNFAGAPEDVRSTFHGDSVNNLVNRYASERFEVYVHFPKRDGQEFPVIEVDPGVKTPVASRRDLKDGTGQKVLVKAHAVYVRSLSSNYTPSTTEATWQDWNEIVERCFENREADIGRFVRRHVGGLSQELARVLGPSAQEEAREFLQKGLERYRAVIAEQGEQPFKHGAWETAVVFSGEEVPTHHAADQSFLNLLNASNPRHTVWPVWIDSRGKFADTAELRVVDRVWEALILLRRDGGIRYSLDFWRADPRGRFYLYRALTDDATQNPQAPKPLTTLEWVWVIYDVAEAIAVALAFARAMGCSEEETTLHFAFRWSGLKERRLSSWGHPFRFIPSDHVAYQDEVTSEIAVPLETPASAIAQYVHHATSSLFVAFKGFSLDPSITENITDELL